MEVTELFPRTHIKGVIQSESGASLDISYSTDSITSEALIKMEQAQKQAEAEESHEAAATVLSEFLEGIKLETNLKVGGTPVPNNAEGFRSQIPVKALTLIMQAIQDHERPNASGVSTSDAG